MKAFIGLALAMTFSAPASAGQTILICSGKVIATTEGKSSEGVYSGTIVVDEAKRTVTAPIYGLMRITQAAENVFLFEMPWTNKETGKTGKNWGSLDRYTGDLSIWQKSSVPGDNSSLIAEGACRPGKRQF